MRIEPIRILHATPFEKIEPWFIRFCHKHIAIFTKSQDAISSVLVTKVEPTPVIIIEEKHDYTRILKQNYQHIKDPFVTHQVIHQPLGLAFHIEIHNDETKEVDYFITVSKEKVEVVELDQYKTETPIPKILDNKSVILTTHHIVQNGKPFPISEVKGVITNHTTDIMWFITDKTNPFVYTNYGFIPAPIPKQRNSIKEFNAGVMKIKTDRGFCIFNTINGNMINTSRTVHNSTFNSENAFGVITQNNFNAIETIIVSYKNEKHTIDLRNLPIVTVSTLSLKIRTFDGNLCLLDRTKGILTIVEIENETVRQIALPQETEKIEHYIFVKDFTLIGKDIYLSTDEELFRIANII